MATAQEVIELHRKDPTLTARAIAEILGCHPGYVRATGQRQNLILPTNRRSPKEKITRKVGRPVSRVEIAEYERLSAKEELAEILYEVFDGLFENHAVFEPTSSIRKEFYKAMKAGQDITGFLMGDPAPNRVRI